MDDDGLSVADTDKDSERSDFTMQHDYAMKEDAIIERLEAYADQVRDPWKTQTRRILALIKIFYKGGEGGFHNHG